jgi:hypothetical protein
MKHAALLAVIAGVLSGCASGPEDSPYGEPIEVESSGEEGEVETTAGLLERIEKVTDLGVSRLHDPAKTVAWREGSTPVGQTFLDGAIRVEHIARQDADNHFGVRVRLLNTSKNSVTFEWRVTFLGESGAEMGALDADWKSTQIESLGWTSVGTAASTRGAVGFTLNVRAASAPPPATP